MRSFITAAAALLAAMPAFAQQATFDDPLVDHLAGKWVLTGQMGNGQVTHDITAEWVLAHQYLEDGSPVYQAKIFIGWDAGKKIYDCVWLDDFGSISTQSLGYASPQGNSIAFVFHNRDDAGSFHTTFTWHYQNNTWSMDMDNVTTDGKIAPFARTTLTAVK